MFLPGVGHAHSRLTIESVSLRRLLHGSEEVDIVRCKFRPVDGQDIPTETAKGVSRVEEDTVAKKDHFFRDQTQGVLSDCLRLRAAVLCSSGLRALLSVVQKLNEENALCVRKCPNSIFQQSGGS
jgi:hypothetical protein